MSRKPKRRKTPIYYVHKIAHNIGATLFIFNRYLIKILLIVGIGAGLFYMCARVEHYQQDDSVVVSYNHSHPSEMGKGRYQRQTPQPVLPAVSAPAQPEAVAVRSNQPSPVQAEPRKKDMWLETTDYAPDMEPFLPKDENTSFIQSEVRARMMEIEKNVMKKRK